MIDSKNLSRFQDFEKQFLQELVNTVYYNGYLAKAKLSDDRSIVIVTFFEDGVWKDHVELSWPVLLEIGCIHGWEAAAVNAGISAIRMSGRELKEG